MSEPNTTSVIIDAIESAATDHLKEVGVGLWTGRVPEDEIRVLIDTEQFRDAPRRAQGAVAADDPASFLLLIAELLGDPQSARVYADEVGHRIVAVLNDDGPDPGWRDHRVSLRLRPTPEWEFWRKNGGLVDQTRFAEIIEDGLADIMDPPAAEMLELAQTFHATSSGKAKFGTRLASGQRQVMWEEEVAASAGANGAIAVPETFKIGVRPFVGSSKWEVTARLRFRLESGNLKIGYLLHRPELVERDAFLEQVDRIRLGLTGSLEGLTVVSGWPADERRATWLHQ